MAGNGDLQAHDRTYGGFLRMLKLGTIACIVIAAFVVWLIAA